MKKFLAMLLCLAMVGALVACGGTQEQTSGTKPPAANSGSDQGSTAGGAVEVVKIGVQGDPEVLSPTGVNKYEKVIEYEVYDRLFNKVKGDGDYDLLPIVGKSYTYNEDDLTIDVEIFDYVTDSAGNKVTAQDVAFCYNNAKAVGERNMGMFDEAVATSDTTLVFKLNRSFALGELATFLSNVDIFNQSAWEADGTNFATKPVATGPYVVLDFVPGYSCTIEAREDYWQTDEQYLCFYQKQNVKTVEYYFITESTQMAIALQTGTIDYSCSVNYADMANFVDGGAYADEFDTTKLVENLCFNLMPNCNASSPFSDVRVRQACMLAIDNALVSAALSGGEALPLKAVGHSAATDYNTEWDTADTYYNKYDVEQAKDLLAQAGYVGGFKAVFYGRSEEAYQNIAAILQGLLGEIGIELDIKLYDETTLNDYQTNPENWDLLLCTWPSGDNVMRMYNFMFNDENWNYGTENFIDDAKLQELFDTAYSVNTHNKETVDELFYYVTDNGYVYDLVAETYNEVYRTSVFADTPVWNGERIWILPGACEYVGQ